MTPRTLVDKIWDDHLVQPETDSTPAVLYVDLHLVHEVTSPQAFSELRTRGINVRRPDLTLATMDHSTPTTPRSGGHLRVLDAQAATQLKQLETNCEEFGIELFGLDDTRQGIVHVIGPEQGLTQPGMTIVCGDSHTSTHGAFGALAFGIGTSEVGYVLATQTLLQRKPRNMEVSIDGILPRGVTAKDIILAIIAKVGIGGATGKVLEYSGSAIRSLGMEARERDSSRPMTRHSSTSGVVPTPPKGRDGILPSTGGGSCEAMTARPTIARFVSRRRGSLP